MSDKRKTVPALIRRGRELQREIQGWADQLKVDALNKSGQQYQEEADLLQELLDALESSEQLRDETEQSLMRMLHRNAETSAFAYKKLQDEFTKYKELSQTGNDASN